MSIELVLGLDLETTGLDPALDGILEICMKVVAPDFKVLDTFQLVVRQPQATMDRMSAEVLATHQKSGLLQAIENYGIDPFELEAPCWAFVMDHWGECGKPLLLGNSIHFDRRFLKAQLPKMEALLHYRMIDVSSIREAIRIFGAKHRADADVDSSIDECRKFIGRIL